jgi:hypothetical protein
MCGDFKDRRFIPRRMIMDRREFLAKAGLVATWAAVSVRISGCSDDESNPMDGGNGDVQADVSVDLNHTHPATITEAQIQAGNAVTITLRASSGHTHEVSLSADEVMTIGAGGAVIKVSTNDSGHTHTVAFNN